MKDGESDFAAFVENWASIVDWFGEAPSFHDSEVTKLELARASATASASASLHIHCWDTDFSKTGKDGTFLRSRDAIIGLSMFGISSLQVEGWNNQNVLNALRIERAGTAIVVSLEASYGVAGIIECDRIEASLSPLDKDLLNA